MAAIGAPRHTLYEGPTPVIVFKGLLSPDEQVAAFNDMKGVAATSGLKNPAKNVVKNGSNFINLFGVTEGPNDLGHFKAQALTRPHGCRHLALAHRLVYRVTAADPSRPRARGPGGLGGGVAKGS